MEVTMPNTGIGDNVTNSANLMMLLFNFVANIYKREPEALATIDTARTNASSILKVLEREQMTLAFIESDILAERGKNDLKLSTGQKEFYKIIKEYNNRVDDLEINYYGKPDDNCVLERINANIMLNLQTVSQMKNCSKIANVKLTDFLDQIINMTECFKQIEVLMNDTFYSCQQTYLSKIHLSNCFTDNFAKITEKIGDIDKKVENIADHFSKSKNLIENETEKCIQSAYLPTKDYFEVIYQKYYKCIN